MHLCRDWSFLVNSHRRMDLMAVLCSFAKFPWEGGYLVNFADGMCTPSIVSFPP